jgi:hypothetical protein
MDIPHIVLNGKIDWVMKMRENNWIARAFGIVLGQGFFGFVIFKRKQEMAGTSAADRHFHSGIQRINPDGK